MEPQHPPLSATQLPTDEHEHEHAYNEKHPYSQQQRPRPERGSKHSSNYDRGRDSIISHPFSPKQSCPPSPASSISSVGRKHRSTTDIQPSAPVNKGQNIRPPPQVHLDPEKHGHGASHCHRSQRNSGFARGANDAVYDQRELHEKAPEEKAWQLLLYLSAPCVMLSVVITLWTIVALLVSLALAPLKLCTKRPRLSSQITTFLAPALNLQLHLVYSHNAAQDYSAPILVVIHLFGPVIAFGVAIAAWTAAGFWFFSSLLGDPGGHDGHNDGKESILGVRHWWERWLSRGLRRTAPE